ncbi:hypothetical protein PMZ80_000239 [Knufia obscura]|uniref:Uncharacterized protein n=2 Tax=Knufia TaxID=430999 RepID=A0AAN8ER90_9EURO|nr:hypothetical protein PMZ80_000239 [Knufia obscura]KAK5956832.1 hypothetical protein OHC33_002321 [Knufia fluminis]
MDRDSNKAVGLTVSVFDYTKAVTSMIERILTVSHKDLIEEDDLQKVINKHLSGPLQLLYPLKLTTARRVLEHTTKDVDRVQSPIFSHVANLQKLLDETFDKVDTEGTALCKCSRLICGRTHHVVLLHIVFDFNQILRVYMNPGAQGVRDKGTDASQPLRLVLDGQPRKFSLLGVSAQVSRDTLPSSRKAVKKDLNLQRRALAQPKSQLKANNNAANLATARTQHKGHGAKKRRHKARDENDHLEQELGDSSLQQGAVETGSKGIPSREQPGARGSAGRDNAKPREPSQTAKRPHHGYSRQHPVPVHEDTEGDNSGDEESIKYAVKQPSDLPALFKRNHHLQRTRRRRKFQVEVTAMIMMMNQVDQKVSLHNHRARDLAALTKQRSTILILKFTPFTLAIHECRRY